MLHYMQESLPRLETFEHKYWTYPGLRQEGDVSVVVMLPNLLKMVTCKVTNR